jgi:hypothetical protein
VDYGNASLTYSHTLIRSVRKPQEVRSCVRFSPSAKAALEDAIDLAAKQNAEIILVHAQEEVAAMGAASEAHGIPLLTSESVWNGKWRALESME